jgi:DNA-binding CsgD family transcriptional regulator
MNVSRDLPLLERESELAELAANAAAVQRGMGRVVFVEGPAGIGKTELLGAARLLAEETGMLVAHARGSELESRFAFGVVRQLFEPLLRTCSRAERARLLRGPAGLAAGVLSVEDDGAIQVGGGLAVALHGLYWLTLNLAERTALVALIDDAHWADQSSLRFLGYLAGRLEGARVLAVLAVRSNAWGSGDLLATVAREPSSRVMELLPLSEQATVDLITLEYRGQVEPDFARACRAATGGNPFYLRELVRTLRTNRITPTTSHSPLVAGQASPSVARTVLARMAGLSPGAVRVARALAVLGGEAEARELAEICGLEEDTEAAALDDLGRAEIVVDADPVAFVHPIVYASIYADIPPGERARAHRRAARLLASSNASPERVAAHLLAAGRGGDRWEVDALTEAAAEALARGAPDSAVAYLTRALGDNPARRDAYRLVGLLGQAKYLAHQPGASAHLIEAMNSAPTAADRAELALQAAKALIMSEPDGSEDAVALLDRTIGDLADAESALSMRLEAQLLAAAGLKLSTRALQLERLNSVYPRPLRDRPADRLLLANLAHWTLVDGRVPGRFGELTRHAGAAGTPAELARRVAERAIADGELLREEGSDSELLYIAIATLCHGDFLDHCERWLDEALEDARRRGSILGYTLASAAQAEVAYRQGRLANAEAHARAAAATSPSDALAVLINILIERGRLDEAQRMLDSYALPADADHYMLQPIRGAAGRLKLAQGQAAQAMDHLLACGNWLEAWPARNPAVVAWRSSAALALLQAGEHDQARLLATEEAELARTLGQPRALGIALGALALSQQGSERIDLLREAIDQLEDSAARLEHARALIDFGAALRRTGHRADARQPLREGLDLAHRSGATALTERARHELLATGARPRRIAVSGRDALTPTEARVAGLAAQGRSTPEIAQALFITPKTVETHLSHTYQKLGIHTRDDLGPALSEEANGRGSSG